MYLLEGFVLEYVNKYDNRTRQRYVSIRCSCWEEAQRMRSRLESECVEADLAILPAQAMRRVQVAL